MNRNKLNKEVYQNQQNLNVNSTLYLFELLGINIRLKRTRIYLLDFEHQHSKR